jgi:hypothetical protein
MSDNTSIPLQDRTTACRAHIGALLFAVFSSWLASNFLNFRLAGVGGVLFALLYWLTHAGGAAFVRKHAAEAFNFNLSMFLYSLAFLIIWQLTDGILFLIMLPVAALLLALWFVCPLMAYKAARNSQEYRYPMTLHLLK